MGTTANLNFPFPELAGENNPPADIQALAQALDSLLKKTTGASTYAAGWADISGDPTTIDKTAGIATLYLGAVKSAASTAGELICTLPVGFRPARKVRLTGNNAGASRGVSIATDGKVTNDVAQASGALSAIVGTVSFTVA